MYMFVFMFLAGFCILTFPLMGLKDFKNEKKSHKMIRISFIGLAFVFLIGGTIDLMTYL
ncbi:hypothetical protein GCM10010954_30420 [Halobacillus andaensis]|uniref:Uncharacterized protein n=1 Tax=Halobacillus andaensis TaxID=1176239 RepID=A0A917B804_HALAA|nr:hypothetical protein [Halobacillus andaensis]MBP2005147.1 hypothetical protein [Halobacillus andaensis]GGF29197.1 hypothetical protein GCM10010954_30420 [Halobacillus andaensis]